MILRILKTEADYEEALAEIDGIFEAKPNTTEGDRLDLLARVAEVLHQRGLSVGMIRRLHQGLGISADILIQPYSLADRPSRNASRNAA